MTALAGFWRMERGPDPEQSCVRMLASQALYGRDASDSYGRGDVALGRQLARTVPEDRYDAQPLSSPDDRYFFVADTRLENRDALIVELGIDPEQARAKADSDILLAALGRWHLECFDHIAGPYAFAAWDRIERRLILARDPLGQRPLHYHQGNGFFALASMPKGLHALPEIPREPDADQVARFLALMPETGVGTMFRGVSRVPSGCYVLVDEHGLTTKRHWALMREPLILPSHDAYVEVVRAAFDKAVATALRGVKDKVASQLSGGLDSSGVTATAARLMAGRGGKVVAFTHVPREGYDAPSPDGAFGDEGPHAAETAAMHPNIEHVLVRSPRSPIADLDRDYGIYDRPVLNLCNNTWVNDINDQARARGLTVMLNGGNGNLTLSYGGKELLSELFGAGRFGKWFRAARASNRTGATRWRGALAHTFGPWIPPKLWTWLNARAGYTVENPEVYSALRPQLTNSLVEQSHQDDEAFDPAFRPFATGAAYRGQLMKRAESAIDNKGMLAWWGIDHRDPMSDQRFVELCLSIPTEQFKFDGLPKSLARHVLADRVPHSVLYERRQGYQGADWHENMDKVREGLAEEVERLEAFDATRELMDTARLRKLLDSWPTEGFQSDAVTMPYRYALLRAISAGHFLRRASGTNL